MVGRVKPSSKMRRHFSFRRSLLLSLLCLLGSSLISVSECYLTGGDVTCDAESEGRIIQVPRITDITPCIQCKCSGGVVKCSDRSKSCPSIRGCYNIVPTRDKCCPFKCKDCNSIRRQHGALWLEGKVLHQCYAGIVTTSNLLQQTHLATNSSDNNNSISCKTHQNQILEPQQTLPDPSDPCATCICLPSGQLHCFTRPCPVLDCPERLIVRKPSKCCPVCSRNRDLQVYSQPNNTCLFQGRAYPAGAALRDASCPDSTQCFCKNGLPVCQRDPCPSRQCPAGSKRLPGKCCPDCEYQHHPLGHILKGYKSSCVSGRRAYKEGESWKMSDCVQCVCSKGEVKCKTETCDKAVCPPGHERVRKDRGDCCEWECLPKNGICTVFGDPHYRTFDGRIFNFQGSCKYLLSQECEPFTGSPLGNSSFSIRVTNDARGSGVFSWTRTVTVRTPGLRVSLLQRMRVKINGKKVSLPYIKLGTLSIMQDSYRIVLRTNEGVRLLWDGISFLEVALPPKFRNRVCGLCGNFNGDKRDDFFGSTGKTIAQNPKFGESWRVGGLKSCSVSPMDHQPRSLEASCSQDWESKIKSDRNCNAFLSPMFRNCRSRVSSDYYYNACKLDMCECPGDSCHCEVLTAYVRECERQGLIIPDWREATDCSNITMTHRSFSSSSNKKKNKDISGRVSDHLGSLPALRDPGRVITLRRKTSREKSKKNKKKARLKKKKSRSETQRDRPGSSRRRSRKEEEAHRRKRRRKKKKRRRRKRKKNKKKKKGLSGPHFEALLMGEEEDEKNPKKKLRGRPRRSSPPVSLSPFSLNLSRLYNS